MVPSRQLSFVFVMACLLLAAPFPSRAATIVVDTTADTGSGNCTLRDALEAAQTDSVVDACTAGSGHDVIDLTALSGTITLDGGSGTLFPGDVEIAGPGARELRISGANLGGAILIQTSNSEIRDVTMSGDGNLATCLRPSGTLTLDRVRVTNCERNGFIGAALNTGLSTVYVTIRNSTFDNNRNTGGDGGAIGGGFDLQLTVTNSTFSNNTSSGNGGAIWVQSGSVKLRNVTFSGNTASGGNGAAIYSSFPSVDTANSVFADSTGSNCSATMVSSGYNLSDDASCALAGTGDQNNVEDGLPLTLANYGGPTDTVLPGLGSAVINGGDPGGCADENGTPLTADQRGVARPQLGRCDIGAVETTDVCGDGILGAGEQCDDGNASNGDCCSASCQFESSSSICRADAGDCDVAAEYCTGTSSGCPSDAFYIALVHCDGASNGGPCNDDSNDHCSGTSSACVDAFHNGASCDDGGFCTTGDVCSGGVCTAGTGSPCPGPDGDGNCVESCDESLNNCSADDPETSPCADGGFCSDGDCGPGPGTDCEDGNPCTIDSFVNNVGCTSTPAIVDDASCFIAGKSGFSVKDAGDDKKSFKWSWKKGAETMDADFGTPSTSTTYALCVFDRSGGTPSLAASYVIAAGSMSWTSDTGRITYSDKEGSQAGITSIKGKSGAADKSSMQIKAKGSSLTLPTPHGDELFLMDPSLTVQLLTSDGSCWTTSFTAAKDNTATSFKATAP